jgi:hypothetical protein
VQGCFMIDSATYLISAALLKYRVKGTFLATEEEMQQKRRASSISVIMTRTSTTGSCANNQGPEKFLDSSEFNATLQRQIDLGDDEKSSEFVSVQQSQWAMLLYGFRFAFVEEPLVGAYALLKGTAALAFGATDVLNVSFSARGSEDDPEKTSLKLGALFCCVGIGCIGGSMLCDMLVTLSQPLRIVRLCLVGYIVMSLGCLMMGMFPDQFACICLSGIIRSSGSSLIWINSVLLLQKYSPPIVLGRIRSIDVAAALLGEAVSAMGAGLLMDNLAVSPEQLSLLLAVVSLGVFFFWTPFLAFHTPKEPFSSFSES